jgi:hypothetical protein
MQGSQAVTQPTRHPQEPNLTPEEIQRRIALVRAAKIATADSLTTTELDTVLAPGGGELNRRKWTAAEKNKARQADLKRAWRARNKEKIREYCRARKAAKMGRQAP